MSEITITLNAEKLEHNLVRNFTQALGYAAKDSLEDLKSYISEFSRCVEYVIVGDWSGLFNSGYTSMVLDDDMLETMDMHFQSKKKNKHTDVLTFEIYDPGLAAVVCQIKEQDISY
jgi:hypothetical protein